MAVIMAPALSWFDGVLDYTIHGLSGHHTLAQVTAHTHRRGVPATATQTALTYFSFRNNGCSNHKSWKSGQSECQSGLLRYNPLEKRAKRAKKRAMKRIL